MTFFVFIMLVAFVLQVITNIILITRVFKTTKISDNLKSNINEIFAESQDFNNSDD